MANTNTRVENQESTGISRLFDIIGGIFKPVLVVIIGAGILQALRDILLLTGVISRVSSSYIFLNAMADAVFYFLPIFLAFSSASIFDANPYLAAAVAAFLLYPDLTDLFEWANSVGWQLTFFGTIPVTYAKYTSSVLPIILIVWFQSKVEVVVQKISPDLLKPILYPVLTMFITSFVGLILLGPIGTWIGDLLASAINWLDNRASWLVPTVVGAASPFLVITGSHYSLFPVATMNLAQKGYDTVLMPGMMASNMALAGASFAVAMKTKQDKYRSYSISAGITSLFGISQSSLYGNAIPLKKPLTAAVIGGGIGGFYAGITGIRASSFVTPGLLSVVGYLQPTSNLINMLITCAISFVATFIITAVLGFEDVSEETAAELTGEAMTQEEAEQIEEEVLETEKEYRKVSKEAGEAGIKTMRARTTRGATVLGETIKVVKPEAEVKEANFIENGEDDIEIQDKETSEEDERN